MNRLYLLLAIIVVLTLRATAQDLSGKWIGFLDQTAAAEDIKGYDSYWEGGIWEKGTPTCYMELRLEQEGDSLKGTYYCSAYLLHELNATFRLVGHVKDDKLSYKTVGRIEEESTYGKGFCHNNAVLRYYEKDSMAYLEGNWKGFNDKGKPCADAIVKLQKKLVVLKEESVAEEPIAEDNYEERLVVVKEELKLKNDSIQIEIWDDNREDGDSISLLLNDKWLVQKTALKNQKKVLEAVLQKGDNILVIYAENLGEIPPNTAAINIKYGDGRHKKIILQSNFWTSEAIRIKLED